MGLQDKEIKFHSLKNENGRNYKELIQIKYLSSYSKIIRPRLQSLYSFKKADSKYETGLNILVFYHVCWFCLCFITNSGLNICNIKNNTCDNLTNSFMIHKMYDCIKCVKLKEISITLVYLMTCWNPENLINTYTWRKRN